MVTALVMTLIFAGLFGTLWGCIDAGIMRLLRNMVQETPLVAIIRIVVASYLAQFLTIMVLHYAPGGLLPSILMIVVALVVYTSVKPWFLAKIW